MGTNKFPDSIDTSKPEDNLEGALNGIVASTPDNKAVSSNITTFKGYKALEYLIKNKSVFLKGKAFFKDKEMYNLMHGYEETNYKDSDFIKFVDSFSFLNNQ